MRIGELAAAVGVTTRTVRHYHHLGLLPEPERLRIITRVNGEVVQDGSTADQVFSAPEIAAYASGCMTLRPGDVIATGTPDGVGFTRQPPRFLRPGDTVEVEIDQIGRLVTPIVPAQAPQPG